jgi:hypothetical protein
MQVDKNRIVWTQYWRIAAMSVAPRFFVRVAAIERLSTSVAGARVELEGLGGNPDWLEWAISAG